MREYVAIGQGVIDLQAVADAVKAIGFTGFLSLEQDGSNEDMKETCRRYLTTIRQYLSDPVGALSPCASPAVRCR